MSLKIDAVLKEFIQKKFPHKQVVFGVSNNSYAFIMLSTPCEDFNIHYEVCNRYINSVKHTCIELHFEDHNTKNAKEVYKKYIDKISVLEANDEYIRQDIHQNKYPGQYFFRLNYENKSINDKQDLLSYLAEFIEKFDKIINDIELSDTKIKENNCQSNNSRTTLFCNVMNIIRWLVKRIKTN